MDGLPMGAASSPPITILVVDKMEMEKFPNWENDHVILWSRYIDDIFILSKNEEKLQKLLNVLQAEYEVKRNEDLFLFTVRHYTQHVLREELKNRTVLLTQKTRHTIQMVVR